ncbi:hypothetical protein HHB82_11235, partial [Neisseria meningitidis]|nr:hypothetical protein [Neisseria meningitidis]MBW4012703.1 hypothetical protein [Neisseria meningitidis]
MWGENRRKQPKTCVWVSAVGRDRNFAKVSAYYFHRLRLLIYQNSPHLEMFDGEVEADESYFGGQRKGKRGR